MNVTVRVDAAKVQRALAGLSEATSRKTIYRSLNKAVDAGKTEAVRYTRAKLNLKRAAAAEAISVRKAASAALTGQILIVPKAVPLIDYSARQTQKGVTVQIYKGGSRKLVRHAFKARMKSGHIGVFTRHEEGQMGRSGRLPIRQLFSLSVRLLFSTPIAVQHVTKVAAEVFVSESKRLVALALKQARAA